MKHCPRCGQDKPLTDYYVRKLTGRLYTYCKLCYLENRRVTGKPESPETAERRRARQRAFKAANYERIKENARRFRVLHREERLQAQREYYLENKDQILAKGRERYIRYPDEMRSRGAATHKRLKTEVINGYGGRCYCCGESHRAFLTLDHVNDDGAKHRREGLKQTATMYRWAIKNGFPDMLQLSCFNCNTGRHINGGICPHEETVRLLLVA